MSHVHGLLKLRWSRAGRLRGARPRERSFSGCNACVHACSHVCMPPLHVLPGVASAPVSVCNAFTHECDACVLICPHVHTQPRRSAVVFWCLAKKNGWQGNCSFVFPGKLKNFYSCRLSAVCGAEDLHVCSACGLACRRVDTQPRRSVVCFWCGTKRNGGPKNNSFAFPGKLKNLYNCTLSAVSGAENLRQQGRRQGAAWRRTCGFSGFLGILLGAVCPSSGTPGVGMLAQASQVT